MCSWKEGRLLDQVQAMTAGDGRGCSASFFSCVSPLGVQTQTSHVSGHLHVLWSEAWCKRKQELLTKALLNYWGGVY